MASTSQPTPRSALPPSMRSYSESLSSNTQSSITSSEFLRPLQPKAWVPDAERSSCTGCDKPFNVVQRRHHCRLCGDVFCGMCSSFQVIVPVLRADIPMRVCKNCFASRAQKPRRTSAPAVTQSALHPQPKTHPTHPRPPSPRNIEGSSSLPFTIAQCTACIALGWYLRGLMPYLLAGWLAPLPALVVFLFWIFCLFGDLKESKVPPQANRSGLETIPEENSSDIESNQDLDPTKDIEKSLPPGTLLNIRTAKEEIIWALISQCFSKLRGNAVGEISIDNTPWEVQKRSNGVVVESCKVPNCGMRRFRAIGEVDAPYNAVWSQLFLADERILWDKEIETVDELEDILKKEQTSAGLVRVATRPAAGGAISSRDFIDLRAVQQDNDGALLLINRSIYHENYPERPGYVRGENYGGGGYIIEKLSESRCKLTMIAHLDLKGNIPYFILNNAMSQAFISQYVSIRERISRLPADHSAYTNVYPFNEISN